MLSKLLTALTLLVVCYTTVSCGTPPPRKIVPEQVIQPTSPPAAKAVDQEKAQLAIVLSDRSLSERQGAMLRINDPSLLFRIVMSATSSDDYTSLEALHRINDVDLLESIVSTHPIDTWRRNAERQLERAHIQARVAAVGKITNQTELRDIVLNEQEAFEVAYAALVQINQPEYLFEVARNESLYRGLCATATERLTDQELLLALALETEEAGFAAIQQLEPEKLLQVAMSSQSERVAISTVERVKLQEHLIQIAKTAPRRDVRIAALRQLTDSPTLRSIAMHGENRWERLTAISKITDTATLRELMESESDEGRLANLRLALLEIQPIPNLRLGFVSTSRNYQRMSNKGRYVGGFATLEGESVYVSILHPKSSYYDDRNTIAFESKFPGVFKGGYVAATLDNAKLREVLHRYLRSSVPAPTLRTLAKTAEVEMLKESAKSLVNLD